MSRIMPLVVGTLIILVGLGFVFPAIAQLRDVGALPALGVGLLLLGVVLTFAGGGAVFYGARRLRA